MSQFIHSFIHSFIKEVYSGSWWRDGVGFTVHCNESTQITTNQLVFKRSQEGWKWIPLHQGYLKIIDFGIARRITNTRYGPLKV